MRDPWGCRGRDRVWYRTSEPAPPGAGAVFSSSAHTAFAGSTSHLSVLIPGPGSQELKLLFSWKRNTAAERLHGPLTINQWSHLSAGGFYQREAPRLHGSLLHAHACTHTLCELPQIDSWGRGNSQTGRTAQGVRCLFIWDPEDDQHTCYLIFCFQAF